VGVGVRLHGFLGVVFGVQRVAVRGMRVLGDFVVVARTAVLGGVAVVLRGVLVMLGRLLVVVGDAVMMVGHVRVPIHVFVREARTWRPPPCI
jgi:hypothetical protein